jgi:hypothetical protein
MLVSDWVKKKYPSQGYLDLKLCFNLIDQKADHTRIIHPWIFRYMMLGLLSSFSFRMKAIGRICNRRFDGLKADRSQGDQ